jgi:D-lactate dehydrogenase (cytochrome)
MNVPTPTAHLAHPVILAREISPALIEALKQRFKERCSTALVVREQHGRDESAFAPVPPPAAVVFAESTADVAAAVTLASLFNVPVIPFGIGSSLEGHRCQSHEPGAVNQRRRSDRDGATRRHTQAAQ